MVTTKEYLYLRSVVGLKDSESGGGGGGGVCVRERESCIYMHPYHSFSLDS